MAIRFDPIINLGHLMTAGMMLAAGFAAWSSMRIDNTAQDLKILTLESQTTNLSTMFANTAALVSELRAANDVAKSRLDRLEMSHSQLQGQSLSASERIYDRLNSLATDVADIKARLPSGTP